MSQDDTHQELVASLYQIIANRRLGYDTLLWQVPSLSFTAQAFLFTIALGTSSFVARLISASLAFINAAISIQLMARHRYNEEIDSRLLQKLEEDHHLDDLLGCAPHAKTELRAQVINKKPNWIANRSSYRIWKNGLMLFAGSSLVIIIISFIDFFTKLNLLL